MTLSLIIGGARSGKSLFAQRIALHQSPAPIYVATSRSVDADHKQRIERHRQERGERWTTFEADADLSQLPLDHRIVVIDCVTLWLSNYFSDHGDNIDACLAWTKGQVNSLATLSGHVIFVSNELGQGLHASTRVGRRFTDLQGFVNQYIAEQAETVVLMVAGIPLAVKGSLPSLG